MWNHYWFYSYLHPVKKYMNSSSLTSENVISFLLLLELIILFYFSNKISTQCNIFYAWKSFIVRLIIPLCKNMSVNLIFLISWVHKFLSDNIFLLDWVLIKLPLYPTDKHNVTYFIFWQIFVNYNKQYLDGTIN